ncbi:hypothetical protein H9Q70_006108 [Fusarium xylarioides]|nr:hypothetical protein H9Q70_006108 [Fusarium xylarioides]KAG5781469.1 hypothetical protein H9Q73_004888 [Fusarium xylarioides]
MHKPSIVKLLLSKDASLLDVDDDGFSAVETAIKVDDTESLEILIGEGARIADKPPYSLMRKLPIVLAAELSRTECFRILAKGSDTSVKYNDTSLLYMISHDPNQMENCKMLLDNGATANETYTDKEMLLKRVLRSDSKEMVDLFIKDNDLLNSEDPWDESVCKTPLSFAVDSCSLDMVAHLINKGASVNKVPEGGDSALFRAAWCGHAQKCELLCKAGADVNWTTSSGFRGGWAPIHAAYDSAATLSVLLQHNASVDIQSEEGTVLMMAAKWDMIDTVKVLVAHQRPRPNLDISYSYNEAHEQFGFTALAWAVNCGNYGCATHLVEAGAKLPENLNDVKFTLKLNGEGKVEELEKFVITCLKRGTKITKANENGDTILHCICMETPVSAVRALVRLGAPTDVPNQEGMTPLFIAVKEQNMDVAELLLAQAPAEIPSFRSLLSFCLSEGTEIGNILKLLKVMLDAKVDPNASEPGLVSPPLLYTTIIMMPSYTPSTCRSLVQFLVGKAGCQVNAPGGFHLHPILAAASRWDSGLLHYLIRHGANVEVADSLGRRLIHYAPFMDDADMKRYRLLARAKADLQAPDNYGRAPLHFVAGFGFVYELEWLRRHTSSTFDVNVRDEDGWSPLMWACRLGPSNGPAVELLIEWGADKCTISTDRQWSALKLSSLSGMTPSTQGLLRPSEDLQNRIIQSEGQSAWDLAFSTTDPEEIRGDYYCDGCFLVRLRLLTSYLPLLRSLPL